jgi:glycine cleavage system H protein
MDGFTYQNIFDTKGIEYLAILAFFAMLIPFWLTLNKQVKLTKQLQKTLSALTARSLRIPQGLFFSRYHTWTHLERTGDAKVGLDDLLLHLTGDVKINVLKKPGEKIRKEDLLAEINHNDKFLRIYAPISGEITEANTMLVKNPEFLNVDPYGKGWIYKIKPSSWVADTNSYFLAEDATNWSVQELNRFKDFLASAVGKYSSMPSNIILQDGGELRDQPLSELPDEIWQEFQQDFLSKKTLCRNKKCFREEDDKI